MALHRRQRRAALTVQPHEVNKRYRVPIDVNRFRMSLTSGRRSKSYRVVAISLYEDEAAVADRLTDILRGGGWPKANRSLVVREALILLQEQLAELAAEDVYRYFANRQAKRAGARARNDTLASRIATPSNPSD